MKINLTLELENHEYNKLKLLYECSNKEELKDSLEGQLNNWMLEMLLDQEV